MSLSKSQLKNLSKYFSSQKDVLAVYLYGSFAKDTNHPRSDIDLGVVFNRRVDLYERLGKLYSDLNDLGLPAEVEARDINLDQPPVYLMNVIQGELIYSRDENKRITFEVEVLKHFYDTQRFRDIKYYYMTKRLKEGTYGY